MFAVASIYVHHQFGDGTPFANDIALLRLKVRHGVEIKFSRFVQPACLSDIGTKCEPNTVCEVSGWGKTTDGGPISETLLGVSVPLMSDGFCSAHEVYEGRFVPGRMFCAGLVRGGPDASGGDSGGPLVCRDRTTDRFIAYGIVSTGDQRGCGLLPGIYRQSCLASSPGCCLVCIWILAITRQPTHACIQHKYKHIDLPCMESTVDAPTSLCCPKSRPVFRHRICLSVARPRATSASRPTYRGRWLLEAPR